MSDDQTLSPAKLGASGTKLGDAAVLLTRSVPLTYLLAATLVGVAWLVRLSVNASLEESLPPFVTLFPAVMLSALLAGAGPALFATAVAGLSAQYWLLEPSGFTVGRPVDVAALGLFYASGLVMAVAARAYQYAQARVATAERQEQVRRTRMQSEQALQSSENRYRLLIEQAADGVFVADAQGNYIDVNPAGATMLGFSRDELLTLHIADVIVPEEIPRIHEEIARFANGAVALSTWRFRRKDRSVFVGELSGRQFPDGRLQAIVRDVTDREVKAAKARHERQALLAAVTALQESEARFRVMADGLPLIVWVHDAEGRQEFVNRTFCEFFGVSHEQITSEGWKVLVHEDDMDAYVSEFLACVRERRNFHGETRVRRADGEWRWIESWGRPRLTESGEYKGMVGVSVDVTSRKEAEDRLRLSQAEAERSNQAKSRFLAAVSHDLRQPLSALSIYIGALAGRLSPEDDTVHANMKQCVNGLSEMLSDLLDLSRLDAGAVSINVTDFALDALVDRVISAHAPETEAKGLALRYGYFGLYVRTDRTLLNRIVGNLVSNAVRYTDRGGVLIGCRRRAGKRWLEVWDTGIGIPQDKTDDIFEEFRQLGNFERDRAKGSGIGLTVVAKAAALLGLEVRVRSMPGQGSMFAIELPLGAAPAPVQHPEYVHRPLRIALVEDNLKVAEALVFALRHLGHEVTVAATGAEAMALVDEVPALVISDYRLAGEQTGFDVIAAFRARFGGSLPAVVITGDTDPELVGHADQAAVRILYKPLDVEVIRATIAEMTAPGL